MRSSAGGTTAGRCAGAGRRSLDAGRDGFALEAACFAAPELVACFTAREAAGVPAAAPPRAPAAGLLERGLREPVGRGVITDDHHN